mmetsp:Transcript_24225/g.35596  ORF Transcript_24225/g.35596 Transcript_24225/m.35596 type:complete len:206 (-) Transcript_24225:385-1002(-)
MVPRGSRFFRSNNCAQCLTSSVRMADPEREEEVVDRTVDRTLEEEEDPRFVKCVRDKPVAPQSITRMFLTVAAVASLAVTEGNPCARQTAAASVNTANTTLSSHSPFFTRFLILFFSADGISDLTPSSVLCTMPWIISCDASFGTLNTIREELAVEDVASQAKVAKCAKNALDALAASSFASSCSFLNSSSSSSSKMSDTLSVLK